MVMTEPPPYNLEAYEPPPSLWKLVEENVVREEREEIREILGESLVEQSLELHTEVETLLEIWRDYRDETNGLMPRRKRLPEPPKVRENLVGHIKLLVGSLKEKAKEEGMDPDAVFSKRNNDVLDYVMREKLRKGSESQNNAAKRPSTASSSRDGRETPFRMTPSSDVDMLSATSTLSDQVDSVKGHLNILKIDEVVQQLRQNLADEIEMLLQDITFLQDCLEDESNFRAESVLSLNQIEPTIQDLKEERSRLERECHSPLPVTPPGKRTVLPPTRKLVAPQKPSSAKMKPQPLPSQPRGPKSKSSPMKANHGIVASSNPKMTTTNIAFPDKNATKLTNARSISMKTTERTLIRPNPHIVSPGAANSGRFQDSSSPPLYPSPPSSAKVKPERPSSAQRFRKMVLNHRQESS
ncbi:coiled-coil domain-containing protein 24-like [Glandiceps talaboti]